VNNRYVHKTGLILKPLIGNAKEILVHAEKKEKDWVEYFRKTNRSIFRVCSRNRRIIEVILQHTPNQGKVLEAGCGTALLSFVLSDLGYFVTAMDLSEDVIKYAQSRFPINPSFLSFKQGDIFRLASQYQKRHFDTVCHSGLMEHFDDDNIVRGLREQRIVSKKVIFSIPNKRIGNSSGCFGDERFLSNKKWKTLIVKAGFQKVHVYGDYDLKKAPYIFLPGLFFHAKYSFWWKWVSRHSIFLCE